MIIYIVVYLLIGILFGLMFQANTNSGFLIAALFWPLLVLIVILLIPKFIIQQFKGE